MNSFFRGLMFGIAGLFAGFVAIFVVLSIVSAFVSSQASGHTVISLHILSPYGAVAFAFLLLMFFGGFSFGARRHTAPTH